MAARIGRLGGAAKGRPPLHVVADWPGDFRTVVNFWLWFSPAAPETAASPPGNSLMSSANDLISSLVEMGIILEPQILTPLRNKRNASSLANVLKLGTRRLYPRSWRAA